MDLTLLSRAAGAMAAVGLGLWVRRRRRPPGHSSPFGDLMGAVLAGLAVGRLIYLVGEGVNLLDRPLDFLMVRGGISAVGAVFGALGYLAWACRSDLLTRMDYLAPPSLWGLAAWEAGCWWQGACLGSVSGLWWAVALPGSDLTRHPAGVYEALLLAVAALLLGWRTWPRRGAATWTALGWVSLVRLGSPLWSVETWSGRTWWYLLGFLAILVGLAAAVYRTAQEPHDPSAVPPGAPKTL